MEEKKYTLGILTYFKNERSILYEWLTHYKKWGVDHVWLIDNGSQDNYDITKFIDSGFVTIYKEPNLGQRESYGKYISEIKPEVKWLCVFDADEFLYSKESDNLKKVLEEDIDKKIHQILIQMTLYYPSVFEHPKSVIDTNIKRLKYDSSNHPKCIYNMNHLSKVEIHVPVTNNILNIRATSSLLCINHYRYMSFEYMYGIKECRGGGVHKDKYRKGSKATLLEKSELEDDLYLKQHSNDILEYIKENSIRPDTEIYPKSSWIKLKNNKSKYEEFLNKSEKDGLLSEYNILEINEYMNKK